MIDRERVIGLERKPNESDNDYNNRDYSLNIPMCSRLQSDIFDYLYENYSGLLLPRTIEWRYTGADLSTILTKTERANLERFQRSLFDWQKMPQGLEIYTRCIYYLQNPKNLENILPIVERIL